jgi:uncharacterized protein YdhG (YjbR/CyaY superfamily)
MVAKPRNTDHYLGTLPDDQRAALERLRKIIHAALPYAEECIAYQLPAFRDGSVIVAYGATHKHCALYIMSPAIVKAFADQLKRYNASGGTIRFQPDKPLSAALVRRLLKARMAEIEATEFEDYD